MSQNKNLAPMPKVMPKTPQEYYDFLLEPRFYESETDNEYAERKQLLHACDDEFDKIEAEKAKKESESFQRKFLNRFKL